MLSMTSSTSSWKCGCGPDTAGTSSVARSLTAISPQRSRSDSSSLAAVGGGCSRKVVVTWREPLLTTFQALAAISRGGDQIRLRSVSDRQKAIFPHHLQADLKRVLAFAGQCFVIQIF